MSYYTVNTNPCSCIQILNDDMSRKDRLMRHKLRPSNTYTQLTWSTCFGAKALTKPQLPPCQLDRSYRSNFIDTSNQNQRSVFQNVICKMAAILFKLHVVKLHQTSCMQCIMWRHISMSFLSFFHIIAWRLLTVESLSIWMLTFHQPHYWGETWFYLIKMQTFRLNCKRFAV